MPITYEINPELNLVVANASGVVTFEELIIFIKKISSDPLLPYPVYEVWNGQHIEQIKIDYYNIKEIMTLVQSFKDYYQNGYIAVIVSDKLMYYMGQIAKAFSQLYSLTIELFTEQPSSIQWLLKRLEEHRDDIDLAAVQEWLAQKTPQGS